MILPVSRLATACYFSGPVLSCRLMLLQVLLPASSLLQLNGVPGRRAATSSSNNSIRQTASASRSFAGKTSYVDSLSHSEN